MRRRLFPRIPLLLFVALVAFQDRAVTTSPLSTSAQKPTMFLTARSFFIGAYQPSSVAVGDFNGDGKPDLVTANDRDNNLSVLLGQGKGTFRLVARYPVGKNPNSVAVGDFNGDGKLDLVTANYLGNSVSILLGNGDGTFQAAVNYAGGNGPVAVGDFNGDGKLDLVTTNSVLLGKGDGTFKAAVNYAVGTGPQSVAVGDFNGDGKLDLVTANGEILSVLLGKGDGTFETARNYSVGAQGGESVALGDFNGDGAPDVVIADGTYGVAVLLNTRGTVASLTSSPNPSTVGEEVTFTADVHRTVRGSQILAGKMTGTVTFRDGTKTLGTVPWLSHINTFSTSSLSKGKHTITATYSGDRSFNPVTSPPLTQTVQ